MRGLMICLYGAGTILAITLMGIYDGANRHLPWMWSIDTVAQSFIGLVVLGGVMLYAQLRSRDFILPLFLLAIVPTILLVFCFLTHAQPHISKPLGALHLLGVAAIGVWAVRRTSTSR